MTVAKEVELADRFENMGAQMVREAISRTSNVAGDGRTTATVLAAAIVREGAKGIAAGMDPMDLKRGIDLAADAVVQELERRSTGISPAEQNRPARRCGFMPSVLLSMGNLPAFRQRHGIRELMLSEGTRQLERSWQDNAALPVQSLRQPSRPQHGTLLPGSYLCRALAGRR